VQCSNVLALRSRGKGIHRVAQITLYVYIVLNFIRNNCRDGAYKTYGCLTHIFYSQ